MGETSTRKSACGYRIGDILRNTMMRVCSVTPDFERLEELRWVQNIWLRICAGV